MVRHWPPWVLLPAVWATVVSSAWAQPDATVEESFFAESLYPVLHTAQCNLCHNDNGVAAGTQLEFPSEDATTERVAAFGLELMDLVDVQHPEQSLLLAKPTNREEHTGGERIKPGSDEEKILLKWVEYLAGLTEEQVQAARQQISQARRVSLPALSVRRLTHSQYNHTVRDLLGDQSQPANRFPKEDFVRGFKNQQESQGISPLLAEAYGRAAERLARSAFRGGDHRGLIPDDAQSADGSIAGEAFVRTFGLRAFRRPLSETEIRVYAGLFQQGANHSGNDLDGAQMVVEAMLQSPHFLFRVERGPGGPLEQYEIANRLSYTLWDTMPSDQMLNAAERGEYAKVEQIEAAARRMLADPRARGSLEEFLSQWLRFDRVLSATRDRRRYGKFNSELAAAMAEETRQLFNHLVWGDRNFMEFFTADYTFVSSDLARLYELPLPPTEFARVPYPPESGRSGVLGHATLLVLTSKPSETSPTERGLFVRNHFLGHEVPPPPLGVNAALPEPSAEQPLTNRQRLDVHLNSEACASCHRLIDPIGFGFEQYDPIGGYREKMSLRITSNRYNEGSRREPQTVELELDTSAYIQGIEGSEFSTPKELGRILAASDSCQRCVVKQLFRYVFGATGDGR